MRPRLKLVLACVLLVAAFAAADADKKKAAAPGCTPPGGSHPCAKGYECTANVCQKHKLSGGAIAAIVVIPLVLIFCAVARCWYNRERGQAAAAWPTTSGGATRGYSAVP